MFSIPLLYPIGLSRTGELNGSLLTNCITFSSPHFPRLWMRIRPWCWKIKGVNVYTVLRTVLDPVSSVMLTLVVIILTNYYSNHHGYCYYCCSQPKQQSLSLGKCLLRKRTINVAITLWRAVLTMDRDNTNSSDNLPELLNPFWNKPKTVTNCLHA